MLHIFKEINFPKSLQSFNVGIKRYFTPDALSSYKRGAGGRSSFNGVVATVFGPNGFVGETLVNVLGKEGTQMIIAHRCDFNWSDRLKIYGDLGQILYCHYQPNDVDESNLYKAMKYSNVVVNLIGTLFETNNYSFEETHIEIPRRLARIARECGVNKFIHVSHIAARSDPLGPSLLSSPASHRILKTKALGEEAVLNEFPEGAIILKPSTLFGFGDRFFSLYANAKRRSGRVLLPLWRRGEATIKSPLYVFDLARAIARIASPLTPREIVVGKRFHLTGPQAYTLAELCDWMHQLIHLEPEVSGYTRTELDLMIWIKTKLPRIKFFVPPFITPEALEYEFVSEEPELGDLNFADLGITNLDRWKF
ncbi:unnamed protein product [Gordionus sp. m RMFG-2023]